MDPRVVELARWQSGVVARRQLLDVGVLPHEIKGLLRRRDLTELHRGVYVDRTGEPTWVQSAWGAVLAVWPAALCDRSALRAWHGPGRRHEAGPPLHVAVDRTRGPVHAPDGVRLHHLVRLDQRVLWNAGPPRVRIEDATVRVALTAATDLDGVAVLADAVQSRRTTANRLLDHVADLPRVGRRQWLIEVLTDIGEGTCSVLEHGYLELVERPHGLPPAERQVRAQTATGVVYRDAAYAAGLTVELDGRLFHDSATRRDADFDRDLDAAVAGAPTIRISWGQVFDRPCHTAYRIGRLLEARGLPGGTFCPACPEELLNPRSA